MKVPPQFRVATYVVLRINGIGVFMNHHQRTLVMTDITVGHTANLSIEYLDQDGNPMVTAPAPDSPPSWTNAPSDPSVDTFTPSADGLTATLVANAAGTDTVSLTVLVGGKSFPASLAFTVSAAPQTLTSVRIKADIS